MSRIPPLRRLAQEDYPSQSSWINNLLSPLNSFMEQTVAALNKGITLSDNCSATLLTAELDGTWPKKFKWTLPAKPVSVIVGNVYRTDGAGFTLAAAVQVQWQYNQAGELQIDAVVGVTPNSANKYKLVLECKTG